jgi:hypothetical protein
MPNPDTSTATPGRTGPPWAADGTVYLHRGWLSNFAPTPGLRLPFGYQSHHENDRVPVFSARGSALSVSWSGCLDGARTHRSARSGVSPCSRGDPFPRYRIRWDDGHESVYAPAAGSLHKLAVQKKAI